MLFRVTGVALLLSVSLLAIEPGEPLPQLQGEFLTGRDAVLPAAAAGKTALLAIGFTYQSRFAVEAWTKQFRAEFGKDPRVTFFEIPVIGGFGRLGKWFINSGMRRGTPKADHENVITVYGGAGEWKQRLDYKEPDDAYLLLLDKAGSVAWKHTGPFDAAKYSELAAKVKTLLP